MDPVPAESTPLIGSAPEFLAMLEHVSRAARLVKPVLVVGERGTGKELITSRLHYLSARWDQALVKVNCAALTETLLETELFGHEAGAFTGATRAHAGRFEQADGGTLVLDEIGTTSARMQEKILRVIEYGEFQRVGGRKPLTADVRIVASTNEDLKALAERGRFRADLLDRLAFDVIHLPPLRARREDIEELATHFAINITSELKREVFAGFTADALAALTAYSWPGNVRELKNAVERSVYRAEDPAAPVAAILFDPFASPFGESPSSDAAGIDADSDDDAGGQRTVGTPIGAGREAGAGAEAGDGTEAGARREAGDRAEAGAGAEAGGHFRPETGAGAAAPAAAPAAIALPPEGLRAAVTEYERSLVEAALERAKFKQTAAAKLLGLTYHQLRGLLKKHELGSRRA